MRITSYLLFFISSCPSLLHLLYVTPDHLFRLPTHPWFLTTSYCLTLIALLLFHKTLPQNRWLTLNVILLTALNVLAIFLLFYNFPFMGTRKITTLFLINLITPIHLTLLERKAYSKLLSWTMGQKGNILLYSILSIPFLTFCIYLTPGSTTHDDLRLWVDATITGPNDWDPLFLIYLVRLIFLFTQTSELSFTIIFFIKAVVFLGSVFLLSQLVKNKVLQIVLFLIFSISPLLSFQIIAFCIKDSYASTFTMASLITLLYYIIQKQNGYFLALSFFLLVIGTLSRINQISMSIVLFIPLIMATFQHFQILITLKKILLTTFVFFISFLLLTVLLNHSRVLKTKPITWPISISILYITLRENNPSLFPKKYLDSNLIQINQKFQRDKDKKNPLTIIQKYVPYVLWGENKHGLKLLSQYPKAIPELIWYTFENALSMSPTILFYTFFENNLSYGGLFFAPTRDVYVATLYRPLIYEKLTHALYSHLVDFTNEYPYKYTFLLYSILLILSFYFNGFRLLPHITHRIHLMPMVYYITLSNCFLFLPLVCLFTFFYDDNYRYVMASVVNTPIALMLFIMHFINQFQRRGKDINS